MKDQRIGALAHLRGSQAHHLGMLLKNVHMALTAAIEERLSTQGIDITRPQALTLLVLAEHPGASNADLARLTSVSPQTMHQILLRLERDGLVTKKPHPYLGRVLTVDISKKGLDLVARGGAVAKEVLEGVTSDLSTAERDLLIRLLERCLASFAPQDRD